MIGFRWGAGGANLRPTGAALKRSIEVSDALAMRVIQGFGDAQNGRQPPDRSLIVVIQRRVRNVMASRRRLPIVIADQRGHNSAVSALETRNISIERKIFAVLVMPAMADHVTGIVKQRAGFEEHARFRGQMMHWLQLIEEQNAELPYVLGVTLIVFHA